MPPSSEKPDHPSPPLDPMEGELILYQTREGKIRVEVLYETETFWLDQRKIAELFGVDFRTVSYHLTGIYDSGELQRERTLRKIWRVQTEGSREVRREIEFYNLDAIISVGFRMRSLRGTQFRQWATERNVRWSSLAFVNKLRYITHSEPAGPLKRESATCSLRRAFSFSCMSHAQR